MGQYFKPVNVTKKEYYNPHKLGCGLKLYEQVWTMIGTAQALFLLQTNHPEMRGGGDTPVHDMIGRWAGDSCAIIGDYAEAEDGTMGGYDFELLYEATGHDAVSLEERVAELRDEGSVGKADALEELGTFTDITEEVCDMIELVFEGKFMGYGTQEDGTTDYSTKSVHRGEGWRTFVEDSEIADNSKAA